MEKALDIYNAHRIQILEKKLAEATEKGNRILKEVYEYLLSCEQKEA